MTADVSELNGGSGVEFEGAGGLGLVSEADREGILHRDGIACCVGEEKVGVGIGRSVDVENDNLDESQGKELDLDHKVDPTAIGDQENGEWRGDSGELAVEHGSGHDEVVDPVVKLEVTVADDRKGMAASSNLEEERTEEGEEETDEQKAENGMLSEKVSDEHGGVCEVKGDVCEKDVNVELHFKNGQDHLELEDNSSQEISENQNEVEVDSVVKVGEKYEAENPVKEMNLEEEMESDIEVEEKSESAVKPTDAQMNLESTVYDDKKDEGEIEQSIMVENGNLDESWCKDLEKDHMVDSMSVGYQEMSEGRGENQKLVVEFGGDLDKCFDPVNRLEVTVADDCKEMTVSSHVEEVKNESNSKRMEVGEAQAEADGQKVENETLIEMENYANGEVCKEKGEMCKEEVNVEQCLENGVGHLEDSSSREVPRDKNEVELVSISDNGKSQECEITLKEMNLEEEAESTAEVGQESKTSVAPIDNWNSESTVYDDEKQEPRSIVFETDQQEVSKSAVVEDNEQAAVTLLNNTYHQLEQRTDGEVNENQDIIVPTKDANGQTDTDATIVVEETKEPQSMPPEGNKHDQGESILLESQVIVTKDHGDLELATEVKLKEEPQTAVTDFTDQAGVTSSMEFEREQNPQSFTQETLPFESSLEHEEMRLSSGSDNLSIDECSDENKPISYVNARTSLQTIDDSESSENHKATSISGVAARVNKAETIGDPTKTRDSISIEHSDDLRPKEVSSSSGVPHVVDKEVLLEVAISCQVPLDSSDQSASFDVAGPIEHEGDFSSAVDVPSPSDVQEKSCNDVATSVDIQDKICNYAATSTYIQDELCDHVAKTLTDVAETGSDVTVEHVDAVKPKFGNENESVECNTSMVTSAEDESSVHMDDNRKTVHDEAGVKEEIQVPMKDTSTSTLDGEKVDTPLGKRQACYIIRIPRFVDDQLSTKIQIAQSEVNEKTTRRDSIKVAIQKQKVTCNELWKKFEAAKAEERAARAAVIAKRQQIDSLQLMINKFKNSHSIEELDDKIQKMEFELQHVTMPLKKEKQYIHELKQLKHQRDQVTSNMGSKAEIDEALDKKEQIDEQFKILKNELDSLRTEVPRTEANANAARKNYDGEQQILRGLQQQFKDADAVRQKAYGYWRELRNMSIEKNKYFSMYKNGQKAAENYVSSRDFGRLWLHCNLQVEKVMATWNNDDEFRLQYVRSNMNSTLRRLRTSDGRSLGPDEEPPVLHGNPGKSSDFPLPPANISQSVPPVASLARIETPKELDSFPALQAPQKNQPVKPKKSAKPITDGAKEMVITKVADREEVEKYEKERSQTREEEENMKKAEELSKKEEELRKEKAAAELKEQCRLEQRAKAKAAEERKRRQAEKAEARAEYRAQKQSELSEKKRAKMEKKKVVAAAYTTVGGAEEDPTPATETSPPETARELDVAATTASKRPSRPAVAAKQSNKIHPSPLQLRKKGKRKMSAWMWVLLTITVVVLLFLAGNYISFSSFSFPQFHL